jgi:hypothetical protein
MFGANATGVEAKSLERLRAHVRNNNVAALDKFLNNLSGMRLFQVKADVSLAAVEMKICTGVLTGRAEPAKAAHEVTFGSLDLDHVSTVLGQTPSTCRANDDAREIKDLQSAEL